MHKISSGLEAKAAKKTAAAVFRPVSSSIYSAGIDSFCNSFRHKNP